MSKRKKVICIAFCMGIAVVIMSVLVLIRSVVEVIRY